MTLPARARLLGLAALLLAACTAGSTEVAGVDDGAAATGATATGATGAEPTATAPTGPTGGGLAGPVSLEIPLSQNPTGASMYSCDGVEGVWTYEPGTLPIEGLEMTMTADPVDMAGGDGTLVIHGEITIPGAGAAGFTDTIELEIRGTPDAPTMVSTGVEVEFSGVVEGIPIEFGDFFPEDVEVPIVAGAPAC